MRGLARPLAIVGASAIVAVLAMATILPSTLSPMFRKPPDAATFFVAVPFVVAAWLVILIAYALIYVGRDASPQDERHSSPGGRHPRRIGIGLGLARAMVTFGVTAPLIGVLLAGRPGMSRGLYAVGLGGLLVGMVWMLVTWRSFLDDL